MKEEIFKDELVIIYKNELEGSEIYEIIAYDEKSYILKVENEDCFLMFNNFTAYNYICKKTIIVPVPKIFFYDKKCTIMEKINAVTFWDESKEHQK